MKRIVFICLWFFQIVHGQAVYIIIHGTWCKPFNWHMPGGDFYDALQEAAQKQNASVGFLNWSGKNSHEARIEGAKRLVRLINIYPEKTKINLVTHSHGGNVAILASQIIGKQLINQTQIDTVFAFGTPICAFSYMPDMLVINNVYNFFSFADLIQPVLGLFQREFPYHERIWNIRLVINSKNPEHTELHDPIIAQWLHSITFAKHQEYIAYLEQNKKPRIELDTERPFRRELDKRILYEINNAFLRKIKFKNRLSPSDPIHH